MSNEREGEVGSTYSWSRFRTPDLSIVAALAGRSHDFVLDGHHVHFKLPPAESAGSDDNSRMFVTTWAPVEGQTPVIYRVKDVDVEVEWPDTPAIEETLQADKVVGGHRFIDEYGQFALRALDHWLRALRWQTKYWRIGRLDREQRGAWRTYLHERSTRRKVAAGTFTITVMGTHDITVDEWNQIQAVLEAGQSSPLFYDLYFDGQEHLDAEDWRRAVVDFANACEVLLKTLLDRQLPQTLPKPARDYTLGANVRTFYTKFAPFLLGPAWTKSRRKPIDELFQARNDALHSHAPQTLTGQQCRAFQAATRDLLAAGETALNALRGASSATPRT